MADRKEKKLILVPSDLVDQLLQMAAKQGKSLGTFLQEQLEQVVRANRAGYPLKDLIDFFEVTESLKSAGAVFAPPEVMRFLIDAVYPTGKEKLHGKWYEAGQWYGKYLMAKFPDQLEGLTRLLQASRWDLQEVNVTRKSRAVEVRCISANFSPEETEFLGRFIEGAMHSMGYETKTGDSTRGIVFMVFEEGARSHA